MKKSLALVVSMVMLAGLVLTGCQPPAATDAALVMNLGSEPPEMSSLLTTDVSSFTVLRHVMEGLVRLGDNNARQPGMATSWDVSEDGMTYTFHLRDAKWSNGEPVTANDFIFAWKTLLAPETAAEYAYFGYIIKGGEEFNTKKATAEELGLKAIDEKTLEVTLVRPADYFLDMTAFGVMMPVNEKFYNKVGAEKYAKEASQLIYNGPFTMETWKHEDSIYLKKNPNYWDAANVKLDSIGMLMIKDSNTAINAFYSEDLDTVGVAGAQREDVKAKGFEVLHYGDGATFYIEFNTRPQVKDQLNPLSNINIRQAFSYALDRVGYVGTVLKNDSIPALSYTTPEIAGKTKATFPEEFADSPLITDNDPTAAKAALDKGLAELGITAADVKLTMLSDDSDTAKNTAAYYQECWKRNLGIEVVIETMPFASRLDRLQNDDFYMSSSGWGPDYNDPLTFLDVFESGGGNNHTGYASEAYDTLLDQARAEKDRDKRYDIYMEAEKLLMKDMPIAPVYFRIRDYTAIPSLKGMIRNALQDINLIWAYYEK